MELTADPSAILGSYAARYMGSVPVTEPKGNHVVVDAVKRVRQLAQAPRLVSIEVSAAGIHLVDEATRELIKAVPILDISFTALDPKDKKMFCYITHDPRLKIMACHVFSVKGSAQDIPVTIAEAFRAVSAPLKEKRREQSVAQPAKPGHGETANTVPNALTSPRTRSGALGVFEAKYMGSTTVPSLKVRSAAVAQRAIVSEVNDHRHRRG